MEMTDYGKTLLKQLETVIETSSPSDKSYFIKKKNCLEACELMMKDDYSMSVNEDSVILRFNEFTIADGCYTHTIRGMYVMFYLQNKCQFNGRRAVFTPQELFGSYSHSHLSGGSRLDSFNSFCLGSGPINSTLLRIYENATVDKEDFMLLIAQIKVFLGWESLSGGPYNNISCIPKKIKLDNEDKLSYVGKSLKEFLSIEDLNYSDPFNIKLKDSVEVLDLNNDSEDLKKLESMLSIYRRHYKAFTFREKSIPLEIIIPENYGKKEQEEKAKTRKLSSYEQSTIERKICETYKDTIKDNYFKTKVQINYQPESIK